MNTSKTIQVLADITDEGLFERLATAILREANPIYHALIHPGVNVTGRTVKSPLDGICFVPDADPPHMVAVHHTTTALKDLEKKWLHDPSKVKPRKGSTPAAPAGDLIKTAELVAEERIRTPNLRATLVLTTNEEPGETLVRLAAAEGRDRGLEIDLWSRSRLGHFLDNEPTGQWLRRSFLGIEQELLSHELLRELSRKSLGIYHPPDEPTAWVPRLLDTTLTMTVRRDVTFLVAGSGLGKTVACYRMLASHVENGGFGIVLPHEVVASAVALEQAIQMALRQLHAPLTFVGRSPLSFCSTERPLLVVVEDINRLGQTHLLVEKLANWGRKSTKNGETTLPPWRLICPLRPEALASLGEQGRKQIEPLTIVAGGFTENEGRDAVIARARRAGRDLSPLVAEAISGALGNDPLLIALHNLDTTPEPHQVIGEFVERSLSRAAAASKDYPASAYRHALRTLAGEILATRQIEPNWSEINGWAGLNGEPVRLLSHLAHQGELIRFKGASDEHWLSFRHDRVRDWLLADAAAELDRRDLLTENVLEDPYFVEVFGAVLAWGQPRSSFLDRVAEKNPLALFHALRILGPSHSPRYEATLDAINAWLDNPVTHSRSNLHLRLEALAMLADTDSPIVPAIVCKFPDRTTNSQLARLRNGDISGGVELCTHVEPGIGAPWRDIQIEHAKHSYGNCLTTSLDNFIRRKDLDREAKVGALRLAGHIADSSLATAIDACWNADQERIEHLADYLWAFGECCAEAPERFLRPVCDAWAALSDQPEKEGWPSQRNNLAAHELRWAFHKWPPHSAIDYFIQCGSQDELKWPVTYMLHGMDHPKAVMFVVQELAAIQKRLEGTGSFSPFVVSAPDDWRRAQEDHGRPMSKESRDLLRGIWRDGANDKHLRVQALALWGATHGGDDIEVLRAADSSDELADKILMARLTREDQLAIPAMIEKVAAGNGWWWQYGRYVWSPELTEALDEFLAKREAQADQTWGNSSNDDWIVSELIMRLSESDAERLLLKHWAHIRFSPDFFQAAVFVATPRLIAITQTAIIECPEPARLMAHMGMHIGLWKKGSPSITRESQLRALAPYLHFLSPSDVGRLWEICNARGWFVMRRELLDDLLGATYWQHRWDCDRAKSELDKMVAENRLLFVDHWIDSFLKTDVSWREVLSTMVAWFDERRSLQALKVLASAIEHRGTREDLSAMKIYEDMSETEARQLIANTEFAVRRRSAQ